jgi:RNA polymerase sigma-70 factor (ECF subfamily)
MSPRRAQILTGTGLGQPATGNGLAELYVVHRAQLLRFLRARSGDAAEAEDMVQELWLRLQRPDIGPVGNGRAYLFQMANNMVLDRARSRQRRARRDRLWAQSDQVADADEPVAQDPAPADALIEQEELRRLACAMEALPEGARRAFQMHKIDGCSHVEVAARLGISRSGVEKHVALAMKHLRRALQG